MKEGGGDGGDGKGKRMKGEVRDVSRPNTDSREKIIPITPLSQVASHWVDFSSFRIRRR